MCVCVGVGWGACAAVTSPAPSPAAGRRTATNARTNDGKIVNKIDPNLRPDIQCAIPDWITLESREDPYLLPGMSRRQRTRTGRERKKKKKRRLRAHPRGGRRRRKAAEIYLSRMCLRYGDYRISTGRINFVNCVRSVRDLIARRARCSAARGGVGVPHPLGARAAAGRALGGRRWLRRARPRGPPVRAAGRRRAAGGGGARGGGARAGAPRARRRPAGADDEERVKLANGIYAIVKYLEAERDLNPEELRLTLAIGAFGACVPAAGDPRVRARARARAKRERPPSCVRACVHASSSRALIFPRIAAAVANRLARRGPRGRRAPRAVRHRGRVRRESRGALRGAGGHRGGPAGGLADAARAGEEVSAPSRPEPGLRALCDAPAPAVPARARARVARACLTPPRPFARCSSGRSSWTRTTPEDD